MNHYQPVDAQSLQSERANPSPLVRLGAIDDLEHSLTASWHGISQATYHFLGLLRDFDLRRGWQAYGCNDCAEWMDFKLKISRKTALEKVRVAKALWLVPKIDAAFKGLTKLNSYS